ncbi:hypothetical protein PCG10_008882 [Penicillium crustosum]|uniref:Uncharacterized protein n=2 Tax=Penicillium crustosum TaxID=36656 RepID=A0A9P5L7Z5_PENCR|nr:hypothetical protein PCG10_008882 [Penicillium crustosum]
MHGDDVVKVEILRGGKARQTKLPNANSVPLHYASTRNLLGYDGDTNTTIPIVHPSVLILTKIKRWYSVAESTRPQSIRKARGDFEDMRAILHWLAKNNLRIDFTAYPEKPKEELLPCFRKFYELHVIVHFLLEVTMDAQDFALACN